MNNLINDWPVKISQKYFTVLFLFLFLTLMAGDLFAQSNISYRDLAMRNQQPQSSFDYLILPGSNDELVQFVMIFNFPYSSLPFKKNRDRSSDNKYFSNADLMLEVFKASETNIDKRKAEDISLEGLEPAGRAFWADTVYAKDYEASKSDSNFLSGYIKINLEPGSYNYVLQMKRGEQTENRISRTQKIELYPYSEKKRGDILVSHDISEDDNSFGFNINGTGNTVEYAKDFYAVAYIPQYKEDKSYILEVNKLNVFDEDTTQQNKVFTKELSNKQLRQNMRPQLMYKEGKPYLNISTQTEGYHYVVVQIPNSEFQNSLYQITIKDSQNNIVARDNFRSKWKNMPTSLLNLNVAIDMLRFIADKDRIREINSGTPIEREKKFREFWKERDPSPKTEFNELMAEYYRRIDYTYKNFSTENSLGYNNDRGEVYIKFGPPKDVERKFPKSGPTTEVWTYSNRKFIFQATTGFGDFKLVSKEAK